jgi:hypothetical protein
LSTMPKFLKMMKKNFAQHLHCTNMACPHRIRMNKHN